MAAAHFAAAHWYMSNRPPGHSSRHSMPGHKVSLVSLEPGDHRISRPGALEAIGDNSRLQEQDHGNSGNRKALRQTRIRLGINLYDCGFSCQPLGNGSHRRCEGGTVRSPGSVKLRQDRPRKAGQKSVEIAFVKGEGLAVERHERASATSAAPHPAFHRCRHPIERPAPHAPDRMVIHGASHQRRILPA